MQTAVMTNEITTHQARPIVDELKELRDIAEREHGPFARSTRRLDEALESAQLERKDSSLSRKLSSDRGRG